MASSLTPISVTNDCSLYRVESGVSDRIVEYVASTPESRKICNDSLLTGVRYTRALTKACTEVLRALPDTGVSPFLEDETIALHILRGGLNFGLREALADALDWNDHCSAFLSSQREREKSDPELWRITQDQYAKVSLKQRSHILLGDVVATGTSLETALCRILNRASETSSSITGLTFFTIGSGKTREVFERLHKTFAKCICEDAITRVIYLEGIFLMADSQTGLSIQVDGTDLLRLNSLLTPEFVGSQYEDPVYPLERCTIYDAGSRALDIEEYLGDVAEYWNEVFSLAASGRTFQDLLQERFPELDASRFGEVDLRALAEAQLAQIPH